MGGDLLKSRKFFELLTLYASHPQKLKDAFKRDHRLNASEKNILRAFLLMRDNSNHEACIMALSIPRQLDPAVESMRLFVIGGGYNNLGKFTEAVEAFSKSYSLFPKNMHFRIESAILSNLFQVYMNLHQTNSAAEILAIFENLVRVQYPEGRIRLLRAKLTFHTAVGEKIKALEDYRFLLDHVEQLQGSEFNNTQIQFYNYGVVFEEYEIAASALHELKTSKKSSLTQNYNYMKLLLDHLWKLAPIYIDESTFRGYDDLLNELKFIRALETNQKAEAHTLWKSLQATNPHRFGEPFHYTGYPCVFSKCLDHYHSALTRNSKEPLPKRNPHHTILEALEAALLTGQAFRKEELYFYLYGSTTNSKSELDRISKYLSRLKTEKGHEIVSSRGVYQLLKKAA